MDKGEKKKIKNDKLILGVGLLSREKHRGDDGVAMSGHSPELLPSHLKDVCLK